MDVLTVLKSQWDRIAAVACAVGGVVLLIVGYQGIADSPYVAEELAYLISGGLGGVFLLGVGATLYISADLHDEWRKLDRIEEAILGLADERPGNAGRYDDIVAPVAESRASRGGSSSPVTSGAQAGAGSKQNAGATAGVAPRSRASQNGAGHGSTRGTALAMPRELRANLRAGGVAMTLAFVALMLTYWRAADVSEAGPAFTATASAATVLAVAGVVAVAGMVGMRRQLMRRRTVLLSGFAARGRRAAAPSLVGESAARMPARLLVIPEGRFAHTSSCAMVAGERTETVSSSALPDGILPCAICTPAAL